MMKEPVYRLIDAKGRVYIPKELRERLEERFEDSPFHSQRIQALLERHSFQDRRLLRAFPKLSSVTYKEALEKLREQMDREAT